VIEVQVAVVSVVTDIFVAIVSGDTDNGEKSIYTSLLFITTTMTEILDSFLSASIYVIVPSFICAFIGLCFLLYARQVDPIYKDKPLKVGAILFSQLFFFGLLIWIISSVFEIRARQELKRILNHPDLNVRVDGQFANKDNLDAILKKLKKMRSIDAHNSSPTEEINIELLFNNRKEIITVSKDSQFENEYWIFWSKYKTSKNNEIGRIRTDIFNEEK
jgi:hypothetical protein